MREDFHKTAEVINPETHHEKSDVSVRALVWFFVILVVFGFVMHFSLLAFYRGLVGIEQRKNTGVMTEMARPADMSVPKNQPLLQPFPREQTGTVMPPYRNTPVTDLLDMRTSEDRMLHTYGWVDQQKGLAHIPIEEAMRLTLQRGLPVQTSPVAAEGGGAPQRAGGAKPK